MAYPARSSTQLKWTTNRRFSVSREVLNILRISLLAANWQLFCPVEMATI